MKIEIGSAENTTIYFTRQGGFVASGVLAKIEVNGSEIAQLGVNEYITSNVTGNYRIKVCFILFN